MNKYSTKSKAPKQTADGLLNWKVEQIPLGGFKVIFSDGVKRTAHGMPQVRRIINDRFFEMYY